ncbi:site-specific integrase [Sphingobacterium griseoflavum]|uniref:Uncharacterized protein n=1 Tax=Sphingobacterium griseoflavum TaxID=1474952 RepID=A0ABQ3I0G9_9SPHI|nr:hypothetical protein [Sphingobacterium griseoflavum]GHE44131.1 hypothetical protein GCM10017764_29380 [Sphingobacterium griseoflavum]
MNGYQTETATICRIEKNITFHIAGYTSATTVTLGNGSQIESVFKMLGDTSIRTTEVYVPVVDKKMCEDVEKPINQF